MFVDAFTVQYLQNIRDARKKGEEIPRRGRITPLVSIFAGIILLVCSIALVAAKSGDIPKLPNVHVDMPKMPDMPEMPDLPKIKVPKMPNLHMPNIKLPTIKLAAQAGNAQPNDPIIAGHYQIKKLYSVPGVKCADGKSVTLWQTASPDGSTVFGSVHGAHVVGSIRSEEMWHKGGKFFSLASYNGNQHGILQIDPRSQIVEKINPGDGCLFMAKCAHMAGTWERDSSVPCSGQKKRYEVRQDSCVATIEGKKAYVKANVLFSMVHTTEKEVGRVRAQRGELKFFDHEGCVFTKSLAAGEHQ